MIKIGEGDYERENQCIRLGIKRGKTQIELGSSITEKTNELQTRIDNLEGQGYALLYEMIMSRQIEMYKTNPLLAGTYKELPINNQAGLNTENIDLCIMVYIS